MSDDFAVFWLAYPRRIAKGAARKAFALAIRKTTLEAILSAIEAYKKHKPEQIDFCHPATWLNAERWDDEWTPPETVKAAPVVRPARSLDELKAFLGEAKRTVPSEIAKAKSVDDLPTFLKMIPISWRAA